MSRTYDHEQRIPAILQLISTARGGNHKCRQMACRAKRWQICGRPGCFQGIPRIPPLQLQAATLTIQATVGDERRDP